MILNDRWSTLPVGDGPPTVTLIECSPACNLKHIARVACPHHLPLQYYVSCNSTKVLPSGSFLLDTVRGLAIETLFGTLETFAYAPHSAWGIPRQNIVEVQSTVYL